MMGVEYELFWTFNPKDLSPFVKAFSIKRRYEDAMQWRQGAYIKLAIASSLSKNIDYPKKPMMVEDAVEESEEAKQKRIRLNFMNHVAMLNTRFRKET